MSVYEILIKLKQANLLNECIHNGLISFIYLDYIRVFEDYKKLKCKGLSKMECYSNLSEKYSVSETTIRKIIKKMQPFSYNEVLA